ncbi:MAG TPA: carbohydrate binding domain-containing protein [Cytophagaceae bacterium]|jgi:hypothetical protein|nr:carbohydrate binding domain-containing protein [Cytophagaceae bacterium]
MKKIFLSFAGILTLFLYNFCTAQITSKSITWKATCRNLKSGKEVEFSGTPNSLESFDKLLKENTSGFENTDSVSIKLKFLETDVVLEDVTDYRNARRFWDKHSYSLTETNPIKTGVNIGARAKQDWVTSRTTLVDFAPKDAVEGDSYFHFTNIQSDSATITWVGRKIKNTELPPYMKLESDPEHTWFFFYLHGTENSNEVFQLRVNEQDAKNITLRDFFYYEIPLDFKGWKQLVIPYSALKLDELASTSNRRKESDQIIYVFYQLVNKDTKPAVLDIDELLILHSNQK